MENKSVEGRKVLHEEFKTFLYEKVEFMKDTYLNNGFTKASIDKVFQPLEFLLKREIKTLEMPEQVEVKTESVAI
jgi:hypothetical protein